MKKIIIILFALTLLSISIYSQSQPYVILISFDGFRWDYANRGVSPNIDIMKKDGVSALSLRPDFPSKTFPNHYAIVTGMYPENNGLIANSIYDPFRNAQYSLRDSSQVRNGRWYLGEAFWETAQRNGIISASYFWPGSEISPKYRRPEYYEKYDHTRAYKARVDGIINWLKLPYAKRPHFLTLYFSATDGMGHEFGTDSKEVNQAIFKEDSMLGLLFKKLKEINLYDSTNVILVSDHGMSDISKDRTVNIQNIIRNYDVKYQQGGPFMLIQPKPNEVNKVYQLLLKNQNHFNVYTKTNIPARFHYSDNPFIPDIIISADLGWYLTTDKSVKYMAKMKTVATHGWDNNTLDMQGIFFAMGPAFKVGYKTATINNIDIYPLLSKIFNISPRSNIDGKLANIEFILKNR
ncbi:MAG TPA: alkaline phosphatase family protein [Ignavibacteria bacterium]|nr:alkaline phosphatase family protein [Ignavibacteria bacterium]